MLLRLLFLLLTLSCLHAQTPVFGREIPVTINGWASDAMEPAISPDGNALFFNSLNDGINTGLYYAGKTNDSTFTLVGAVPIVNQTVAPRLDAVASLDSANNFYWVSTRSYPAEMDNLHRIRFLESSYENFGRVHGDFYVYAPGYIIMDATINRKGNQLIYCNAYFNSCVNNMPCKASMGIARKINDSVFNKIPNTDAIMANINDTVNHIVYAPSISTDGLELYYTRLLKGGTQSEILVATRPDTNTAFGVPEILVTAPSLLPEGPSISTDKSTLYYHKKVGATFQIFLRYRNATTAVTDKQNEEQEILLYPNPSEAILNINLKDAQDFSVRVYTSDGILLHEKKNTKTVDLSMLPKGTYRIVLIQRDKRWSKTIVRN